MKSFKPLSGFYFIDLYLDRYILSYSEYLGKQKQFYSYDLNNLDLIEETKTEYNDMITSKETLLLTETCGTQFLCFDYSNYSIYF